MPAKQALHWLATISYAETKIDVATGFSLAEQWVPRMLLEDNDNVIFVKGQQEKGEGGFHHYQLYFALDKKVTLTACKKYFPDFVHPHLEMTRSDAAVDYVWKEETRVPDTQFVYLIDV